MNNYSYHAMERMIERQISEEYIDWVIWLGRKTELLGADLYTFGMEDYWLYRKRDGIDLSYLIGISVKCASTSYRPGEPRFVLTVHRDAHRQAA